MMKRASRPSPDTFEPVRESDLSSLFFVSATVVTKLDIRALTGMNQSAAMFYEGMRERMERVSGAAERAADHENVAREVAAGMASVATSSRNLEALVDRLDEYTKLLEQRLSSD